MPCAIRHGLWIWAGCVAAFAFANAAHADASVPYRVEIKGVESKALRATLRSASDLFALRDKPPATMNLLKRRIDKDVEKLSQVLLSQGYYDAKAASNLDDSANPVRVSIEVDLGPLYTFSKVTIRNASEDDKTALDWPEFAELPVKAGQPARAQYVLDGEKRVERIIKKHGFPLPAFTKRTVELDRDAHTASVIYRLVPGPQGRFGAVAVEGLSSVEETFVRNRIPWKEGDAYNGDLVRKLEERLMKCGLFSVVKVTPAKGLNPDGTLPMTVTLSERKHRTVSASVTYKTDEGAGVQAGWENRNLFGGGEKLELGAGVSNIGYNLGATYTKPDFFRPDQSLVLRSRFATDSPDAFTSVNEKVSGTVERRLTDHTKVGLGLALKFGQVDQLNETQHYGLLSIPAYFKHETSNDPIEPIRGERLNLELAPMTDIFNGNVTLFKSQFDYSRYFDITTKPLSVIAGRITVGTILGATRDSVPADERFYAGGSNSIRGYSYQSVGPLQGKDPLGGKSLLTMSVEYRVRVQEKLDLVGFLDAGNAYSREVPDIGDLKLGSGLGVSYYSKIGPIRLDVGVPLQRRSGIDDAFQVYVNLGHSF